MLSFHGTAGVGKSFVGNMIVENLFQKGLDSKFYHIFHGVSDFPGKHNIDHHKEVLEQKINAAIKSCEYSIFIFDECDKVFPGVFDGRTFLFDFDTFSQFISIFSDDINVRSSFKIQRIEF